MRQLFTWIPTQPLNSLKQFTFVKLPNLSEPLFLLLKTEIIISKEHYEIQSLSVWLCAHLNFKLFPQRKKGEMETVGQPADSATVCRFTYTSQPTQNMFNSSPKETTQSSIELLHLSQSPESLGNLQSSPSTPDMVSHDPVKL